MKEAVPQHWLTNDARTADISHVVGLTYGLRAALDVCQQEAQLLDLDQEIPFDLPERVAQALAFLARYARWQKLGNLLTHEQRTHLLGLVYTGQNPVDHQHEFRYGWKPDYTDGLYQGEKKERERTL